MAFQKHQALQRRIMPKDPASKNEVLLFHVENDFLYSVPRGIVLSTSPWFYQMFYVKHMEYAGREEYQKHWYFYQRQVPA